MIALVSRPDASPEIDCVSTPAVPVIDVAVGPWS